MHEPLRSEIGRSLGSVEHQYPKVAVASNELHIDTDREARASPGVVDRSARIIVAICGTGSSVAASSQINVGWVRKSVLTARTLDAARAGAFTKRIDCTGSTTGGR